MMRPENSWPIVTGICSLVIGWGRSFGGHDIGPSCLELNVSLDGFRVLTMKVFMQITATYTTPLDCDESLMFLGFWGFNLRNADVALAKILCCFHVVGDLVALMEFKDYLTAILLEPSYED